MMSLNRLLLKMLSILKCVLLPNCQWIRGCLSLKPLMPFVKAYVKLKKNLEL